MKTSFAVTTHIRVTPAQAFWLLADPSTAPVIDPAVMSYAPEAARWVSASGTTFA